MPRSVHEFRSASGHRLSGTLAMPAGRVLATALLAHCFTCTQASLAATRLADALAGHGVATLRFDFTGLGKSEGDFAQSGIASNVDDLVAAADFLGETLVAPSLLIGHSLGGAAALVAAARIKGLKAVATIGAPSDAINALKSIDGDLDAIRRHGQGDVTIAGRRFPLGAAFIDQAQEADVIAAVAALRVPLLIAHAPRDEIVSIDHAGKLFVAAKHPKSFLSLDDADHLLTRAADADWVAGVVAAWLARYLPAEQSVATATGGTVTVRNHGPALAVDIAAGDHRWRADEPKSVGGDNMGPTPYDLLLAALGACTAMTIRLVANRESIPVEGIDIALSHDRNHARDCDHCDASGSRIQAIGRVIGLAGKLSREQHDRLLDVATRCPVHRTLTGNLHIHDEEAGAASNSGEIEH